MATDIFKGTPPTQPYEPVEGMPSVTTGPAPDFTDEGTEDPYTPDPSLEQYGYQTGIDGERNYDINMGMTGGLMDTVSAIGDSRYADRGYDVDATRARATTRGVDPRETSAYHLQQITASDSPLMRQMGEQGMARGGARGLMNSSLSTGAAQGAMISGAQPFALQDAGTYARTASENMAARNAVSLENARLGTRAGIAGMEAGAARDRLILTEQLSGYSDIRKGLMAIETREDTQAFATAEREGTQGYNAGQNQLNRDWTSNENMLTNSLAWAQTKMDAAVRLGVTREQAFSEMYASIMANPDPKFRAAERAQAVRDMKATLDDRYADSPAGPYENSYDPATGSYDETQKPDSFTPPPTQTSGGMYTGPVTPVFNADGSPMTDAMGNAVYLPAYTGAEGGRAGVEANFDDVNPAASDADTQQWGSAQSPNIGRQMAALPGVAR